MASLTVDSTDSNSEFLLDVDEIEKIISETDFQELDEEWGLFCDTTVESDEDTRAFQSAKEQQDFLNSVTGVVIGPPKSFKTKTTRIVEGKTIKAKWRGEMEFVVYDKSAESGKQFVVVHVHYVGEDDPNDNSVSHFPEGYGFPNEKWRSWNFFDKDAMVSGINIRHTIKDFFKNEENEGGSEYRQFRHLAVGPKYYPGIEDHRDYGIFFKPNSTEIQSVCNHHSVAKQQEEIQRNRVSLKVLFAKVQQMDSRYKDYSKNKKMRTVLTRTNTPNLAELLEWNITRPTGNITGQSNDDAARKAHNLKASKRENSTGESKEWTTPTDDEEISEVKTIKIEGNPDGNWDSDSEEEV